MKPAAKQVLLHAWEQRFDKISIHSEFSYRCSWRKFPPFPDTSVQIPLAKSAPNRTLMPRLARGLYFRAVTGAVTLKIRVEAARDFCVVEFPRHSRRGHIEELVRRC